MPCDSQNKRWRNQEFSGFTGFMIPDSGDLNRKSRRYQWGGIYERLLESVRKGAYEIWDSAMEFLDVI